jgi:tRNA 2-selenouridine synthase
MPSRSSAGDSALRTAHPHDIGVQEFASYALVIDARSRADYDEDHIPGAVSVPLGRVGSRSRGGKRAAIRPDRRVELGGAGGPPVLLKRAASLRPGDAVLLYGAAADALAEAASWLRARDLVVDVLAGGWPNYRRWVEAGLEVLPRQFSFRVLVPPPATDVERIVHALCELGEQVVDIGACTRTRLAARTTAARREVLSQAAFETWLLNTLRHRETDRILWAIGPHELPATLHLPPAMAEALARAPEVRLDALHPDTIGSQLEQLLPRLRGEDGQSSP